MDLFERLKAAKLAREAAEKAAANPNVTLAPVKPAPAKPAAPVTLGLRRPVVQPTRVEPVRLHSEEVPHSNDDFSFDMPDMDIDAVEADEDEHDDETEADGDEADAPPVVHTTNIGRRVLRKPVAGKAEGQAKPSALQKPAVNAEPSEPSEPAAPASGSALLAKLRAHARGQTPALVAPAGSEAKALAGRISDFTIDELMEGWPAEERDDDPEINQKRAALLSRAAAHLQHKFATELQAEADGMPNLGAVSDIAINSMAQISKMCFLRVKDAPSAYAMLDQADRDALIKGLLMSAAKRKAMSKSRKPKDAANLSTSLEILASEDSEIAGLLSDFDLEF